MYLSELDDFFQRTSGVRLHIGLLLVLSLGAGGAIFGAVFPKFASTAFLQFPEPRRVVEAPRDQGPPDHRQIDPKANVIELATYKRAAASYDSIAQLEAYIQAGGLSDRPGAAELLRQADDRSFWESVAVPVLPFSRSDQKQFGDIKDASATTILGLELSARARTRPVAEDMISIIAGYYINAVVRERVRAWILSGKMDAQSQEKSVRADVLRAELDIHLYGQRIEDLKSMLARYPDAARMDARQVVNVNQSEGGERYLSPLAQLVGAESAISQRRELIRRWQRDLKQKTVLAQFFSKADELVAREVFVPNLLKDLQSLAGSTFTHPDSAQEWNQEATLRVNGALDNFEVMQSQFGLRSGIRTAKVGARSPLRLASLGIAAGLLLLVGLTFIRAAVRASAASDDPAPDQPSRASS